MIARKKRLSKQTQNLIQSVVFFTTSIAVIISLIIYLWVYTEIDETILAIEIQNSTLAELRNNIDEIKNEIESLNRADVIAKKAKKELGMVFTQPETLRITVSSVSGSSL